MDPVAIAGAVSGSLSALASLIRAYTSYRLGEKELTKDEVEQIDKTARQPEANRPAIEVLARIDVRILDTIRKNLDKAVQDIVEILGSTQPNTKKDQARDQARRDICYNLRVVKEYNQGVLPDDDLQQLWSDFSCQLP